MIKLSGLITEKKELGRALIKKMLRMTDRNNHNEARRMLAVAMKEKRFAKAYAGMEEINIALGYLPPELGKLRNRLDKKLFIQAKKMYSDYDAIHGVF